MLFYVDGTEFESNYINIPVYIVHMFIDKEISMYITTGLEEKELINCYTVGYLTILLNIISDTD